MNEASPLPPPPLVVVASDERPAAGPDEPVDLERWRALAEAVLTSEGVQGPAELDLTFVDAPAMAALNATHMGEDRPTDVLSFPLDGPPDGHEPSGGPRLLGDVVVCPSVARANAPGDDYDSELALLVVHGVLHVLGMDHAEVAEAEAMVARERHHLAAAGFERRDSAGAG